MLNNEIYKTVTSRELTHEQKLMKLAKHAENTLEVFALSPDFHHFYSTGAINDLFEGGAPYRPRYILPDYPKFVKHGSAFLQLDPPQDLDELLNSLMILYRHVPSITNFPVYLGSLDELIEPFLDGLGDETVRRKLRLFLTYLDRTITDSFCHANIGPQDTRAGRLLLQVERELQNTVPNLTVLYDPDITPPEFMEEAIRASLVCSNPAICNHRENRKVFGDGYGIASCYNILPTGGGAYTLSRVTLTELVKEAGDEEHFLRDLLPRCLEAMADYMDQRVRFIVEKSGFFESNFLVKEGVLDKDRFVGMFGVTGLAESVNALMADRGMRYGHDAQADELGLKIMDFIEAFAAKRAAAYSPISGGRFMLHAQVGLDSDNDITSGVRIPVGQEPELFSDHLRHSGRFHKYFPTGVGDIFPIASNVEQNPAALLDVVNGAFSLGVRYMSFYSADADLVRITGYLVKRSEMEKFKRHETVLQNTTQLGAPVYTGSRLAERKVRLA